MYKKVLVIFIFHVLLTIGIIYLEDLFFIFPSVQTINIKGNFVGHGSFTFLLISVLLILPFIEECLFRLPLKKNRFSSAVLLLGILYCLLSIEYHILISILMVSVNIYMFYQYRKNRKTKFPISLILLYIIFFTFTHMGNYERTELRTLDWYEFIYLFHPQLIAGCVLTYLRIKFNFIASLLYHMAYNLVVLFPLIILKF